MTRSCHSGRPSDVTEGCHDGPRLLVSVASAAEAVAAAAGGADLIDIKDPAEGPLGAATPAVWREIAAAVAGRRPLSAALGELQDPAAPRRAAAVRGMAFAKVALAGAAPDWPAALRALFAALPHGVAPVVAAYADYQAAAAPSPWETLAAARDCGAAGFLIDTFDKSGGSLFDVLSRADLTGLVERARAAQLLVVVAGSLRGAALATAAALGPDYVGVRGAVCRAGRETAVEQPLVERAVAQLRGPCQASSNASL